MAVSKGRLYELVDALQEDNYDTAERLLEQLRSDEFDPMLWKLLTAPYDDEPVTEDDRAAIIEAQEDIRAGRLIPHEEVMRQLLGD